MKLQGWDKIRKNEHSTNSKVNFEFKLKSSDSLNEITRGVRKNQTYQGGKGKEKLYL